MKKTFKIIVSCVLLITIVFSSLVVFAEAETPLLKKETKQSTTSTYYNLKDGLYTSKTISGPDANGEYTIGIDTYTSDVSIIESTNPQPVDISFLLDTSGSSIWDVVPLQNTLSSTIELIYNEYLKNSNHRVSISIMTFNSFVYDKMDGSFELIDASDFNSDGTLNSNSAINDGINSIGLEVGGGTYPGDGMQRLAAKVKNRQKSFPNNKQLVIFMSDGVPGAAPGANAADRPLGADSILSLGTSEGNRANGTNQANVAIEYANELKSLGVTIFTMGYGNNYKKTSYNTMPEGLKKWLTSGVTTSPLIMTGEYNIRARITGLFMNVLSSNWLVKDGKAKVTYDWSKYDNRKAKDYYNNGTALLHYKEWNDGFGSIVDNYILNEEVKNKAGYVYTLNSIDAVSDAVSSFLVNELIETYVSQGSLITDFSVRDSISSYFEVIPNSTKVYRVPYNGDYVFDFDNVEGQYNEHKRTWGTPEDITTKVVISETTESVELTGFNTSDTSIIDSFVVEDDFVSETEVHKGNKLRLEYKVRPKDAFMGGFNVPIADESKSMIWDIEKDTPVQYFYNMTLENGKEVLKNKMSGFTVGLVDGTISVDNDDVKIGLIYDINNLGLNNLAFTYKGRNTDTEYVYKSSGLGFDVFNKSSGTAVANAADFVTYNYGTNWQNTDSDIIVNSDLVQVNSDGVSLDATKDLKVQRDFTLMFSTYNTNAASSDAITNEVVLQSLLKAQEDNQDNVIKSNTSGTIGWAGASGDTFYIQGYIGAKEYTSDVKLNVFVPIVTSYDISLSAQDNAVWPVSSDDATQAFNGYTAKNVIAGGNLNTDILDYLMKRSTDASDTTSLSVNNKLLLTDIITPYVNATDIDRDGMTETRFAQLEIKDNSYSIKRLDTDSNVSFADDYFTLNSENLKANGYAKEFVSADGTAKNAGDSIAEGDKVRITIEYKALKDTISSLDNSEINTAIKNSDFKLTVDDFYTYSQCPICSDGASNERQKYQIKAHITENFITVSKTGCDENHSQDSFVFTVVGVKENNGAPDISTAKVLSNLVIHGDGQITIPVDTSDYQYFKVIEHTVVNEDKAWSWAYNGVTMNGVQDVGYDDLQNNLVNIQPNESYLFAFNNKFDTDNNNLHYNSRYCTNILTNRDGASSSSNNSYDSVIQEGNK